VLIKAISISIGIAIGVLICGNRNNSIYKNVTKNDTIVVLKATVDTLKLERIKLKTIYEKDIDTIYLMDTTAIDSAYTKSIQRLIELEQAGFFTN
jgi:precorrin-2 methylase